MKNSVIINIGGEERLACFGIQSVMELQDHFGGVFELGEAFKNQDFSLFTAITYYTLKSGSNSKGEKPNFTITDVYDWVYAKKNDDDLVSLIGSFSESMSKYVNDLREGVEKATVKDGGVKKK